jgi:hypothetical protein
MSYLVEAYDVADMPESVGDEEPSAVYASTSADGAIYKAFGLAKVKYQLTNLGALEPDNLSGDYILGFYEPGQPGFIGVKDVD